MISWEKEVFEPSTTPMGRSSILPSPNMVAIKMSENSGIAVAVMRSLVLFIVRVVYFSL